MSFTCFVDGVAHFGKWDGQSVLSLICAEGGGGCRVGVMGRQCFIHLSLRVYEEQDSESSLVWKR